MELSKTRNVPRYQLVADQLTNEIISGQYFIGDYLPTEATLRNQYNISRFTVREAMKILQQKGLIVTRRGVGSAVISQSTSEDAYTFSSDSYTDFLTNASKTHLVDIEIDDVNCDDALARIMDCKAGQKMLRIRATRIVNQVENPFCVNWTETYLIGSYAGIRSKIGEQQAINKMIETQFGVKTVEIKQRIIPVIVRGKLAKTLGVKSGSASLKVTRIYRDSNGEIFEFVTNYHAGEHADLTMNIKPS